MLRKERITVIGAGLMGIGIAQVFACSGHSVYLVDVDQKQLNKVKDVVSANLDNFTENGINFPDDKGKILSRITTTTDMEIACSDCEFVFEAVYENLELKQKIMSDLDRFCSEKVILCSNTSVMSITEIALKSKWKSRILGTHWWNPPYLIPLVEVVRTEDTDINYAEATFELLEKVGKKPIHVQKDVPGFVGNRLQHALWREAFALIDDGVCDPETVDQAIKSGFGLRLPILGPVETADMVGLDLTLSIHEYILKYLNASPEPSKTLRTAVEKNNLGFKTGSGFQQWTAEECEDSKKQLAVYLMKTLSQQNG